MTIEEMRNQLLSNKDKPCKEDYAAMLKFLERQETLNKYTYDLEYVGEIIQLFNKGELYDQANPDAPISDRAIEVGLNLAARRGDNPDQAYARIYEGLAYLLRNGWIKVVVEGEYEGEFVINKDNQADKHTSEIEF